MGKRSEIWGKLGGGLVESARVGEVGTLAYFGSLVKLGK